MIELTWWELGEAVGRPRSWAHAQAHAASTPSCRPCSSSCSVSSGNALDPVAVEGLALLRRVLLPVAVVLARAVAASDLVLVHVRSCVFALSAGHEASHVPRPLLFFFACPSDRRVLLPPAVVDLRRR